MLQLQHHPNWTNHLVPHILISPHEFRIIMYDAVNDILLCSQSLKLFQDNTAKLVLNDASIITLWMVLHYKDFCSGIDDKTLERRLRKTDLTIADIKSNFHALMKSALHIYQNDLKFCVATFPCIPPEQKFPNEEDFDHSFPLLDSDGVVRGSGWYKLW